MTIQTAKELKIILDEYLKKMVWIPSDGPHKEFEIRLSPRNYHKAKYSCTADEKDFQMIGGRVHYKGFKLRAL